MAAGYAAALAERLGADPQVVEAAARLHDTAAVRDAAALPEHARLRLGDGPPEEVCVSHVGALAQIARPAYWYYVVFHMRRMVEPARELIADRYALAAELLAL